MPRFRSIDLDRHLGPGDPVFGRDPWPAKVTSFRPVQVDAIRMVLDLFGSGCSTVLLEAPTGVGKTVIAEAVRRAAQTAGGIGQALYVCSGLSLQRQFAADFPHVPVMWGRANYQPQRPIAGATCADCTWTKETEACLFCPDGKKACSYEAAKVAAIGAEVAVLNATYLLTETAHVGRFKDRGFATFDEADTLEAEVMRFVSFDLSGRARELLGLSDGPRFVTKPETWAEYLIGKVVPAAAKLERDAAVKLARSPGDLRAIRAKKRWGEMRARATDVSVGVLTGAWVFDHRGEHWSFKPVTVDRYAGPLIRAVSGLRLLMSATLVSGDQVAADLGLGTDYATVTVPSPFPLANRPVHYAPVASMRHGEDTTGAVVTALLHILALHPGESVLVHLVSYRRTEQTYEALVPLTDRPVITYRTAAERDAALDLFRQTPGAVLLAPSFERGVDLADDDCRVMVVAKIPFPNKGDAQVKARLGWNNPAGERWYAVSTIRSLVQMTGRGVRHEDDWAVTYVLDRAFLDSLWRRQRRLFPTWWADAVDWGFNPARLTKPYEDIRPL